MIEYQETNSQGNYNYNIFTYNQCEWGLHFHKNFEFIYVIAGEINILIDERKEIMGEEQFAIVLPNQIHSIDTPVHSKVWIGVFSEDFIKEFALMTSGKEGDKSLFYCSKEELSFLKNTLLANSQNDILSLKSSLYLICSRYLKEARLSDALHKNSNLAHRIITYTEKNFMENITLLDISRDLGYEYHYFSRCFRDIFHTSFRTFLNQYRFEYAKNLILNTDLSLAAIAHKSGFGSIRNFNRIYMQFGNITPKEQRKYFSTRPKDCV